MLVNIFIENVRCGIKFRVPLYFYFPLYSYICFEINYQYQILKKIFQKTFNKHWYIHIVIIQTYTLRLSG